MVIFILIAFIVMSIAIDALIQYNRKKKSGIQVAPAAAFRVFNEALLSVPMGLYFDKTHTWAYMEKNGLVKIGIDDFLLHVTGPLNRVTMKAAGEKIQKGEAVFTVIKNGKQLNINSPVSGIIKSQNFRLLEDSTLINSSPFYEGWVYTIEPSNWVRETQFMFMADKYREWLKNEFVRLKDFLAGITQVNQLEPAHIKYQDGGELTDHVLDSFGPEVWEEFQTRFIDTSR